MTESALVDLLKKRLNLLAHTSLGENEYNQTYFKRAGLTNVDVRSYQLHGIRWLIERYEAGHGASERAKDDLYSDSTFLQHFHSS